VENSQENKKVNKKLDSGIVVSDKMDKTIVVAIEKRKLHRLYKKYVINTKKVKAHDEKNEAKSGDKVKVIQSRPISKEKCWQLLEIVEKAK
jgi:small subunit ribosomal protein S17